MKLFTQNPVAFLKSRFSAFTLVFTVVLVTIVTSNLHWGGDSKWRDVVEADARGYYAYLPAVVIYHDLNFRFADSIEKIKYNGVHYYEYRIGTPWHRIINKYYSGAALAQLPFFLTAHSLASPLGYDADGYSKIYILFVNFAAIFYLFFGLFFIDKTLSLFNVASINRGWVLLAIVFGTNLFYYTIGEPGMSHVFSFGFVSLWIYITKKISGGRGSYFNWAVLGIALGMIALIRPVNLLVLFLTPFLAGDVAGFRKLTINFFKKGRWLVVLLPFLMIAGVQLVIYKISTGHWFVYSYGSEGFNFLTPHFLDFLISYKKGFFIYTPLSLAILLMAGWLWRRQPYSAIAYFFFWLILIYVFSSWWNWWYGGSFSTRVLVEFMGVLAIPCGLFLEQLKGSRRRRVLWFMFLLVVICQIQTYQYRYMIIHWDQMDSAWYWRVFLRVDMLF